MIPLTLLLLFNSCEKEYPWKLHTENVDRIVVQGILTNENLPQHIYLSKTTDTLNGGTEWVSGAEVSVSDSDSDHMFTEGPAGDYVSLPFGAVTGRIYTLNISFQGKDYTAEDEMVPITPMPAITIRMDSSRNLYYFSYSDDGTPSMMEVQYDWSAVPSYCKTYGTCSLTEYFYTLPAIDVNKIFAPSKEVIYFPSGTLVIRRKYSLSKAHQEFLRSLLMETEWTGGIFDVQHGNVNTNLSNGALGFFAVCMVLSDTTVVQ